MTGLNHTTEGLRDRLGLALWGHTGLRATCHPLPSLSFSLSLGLPSYLSLLLSVTEQGGAGGGGEVGGPQAVTVIAEQAQAGLTGWMLQVGFLQLSVIWILHAGVLP